MKSKGQIISHTVITVGGVIAAILGAYYTGQQAIEQHFSEIESSIAGLSATENADHMATEGDISDLDNRVEDVQQDFSKLDIRLGGNTK